MNIITTHPFTSKNEKGQCFPSFCEMRSVCFLYSLWKIMPKNKRNTRLASQTLNSQYCRSPPAQHTSPMRRMFIPANSHIVPAVMSKVCWVTPYFILCKSTKYMTYGETFHLAIFQLKINLIVFMSCSINCRKIKAYRSHSLSILFSSAVFHLCENGKFGFWSR